MWEKKGERGTPRKEKKGGSWILLRRSISFLRGGILALRGRLPTSFREFSFRLKEEEERGRLLDLLPKKGSSSRKRNMFPLGGGNGLARASVPKSIRTKSFFFFPGGKAFYSGKGVRSPLLKWKTGTKGKAGPTLSSELE